MTTRGWKCHARAQWYFQPRVVIISMYHERLRHMFCRMTKMAAWELFLQDGGVSKSYPWDGGMGNLPTRWQCFSELYPQDGGVGVLPLRWGISESFTHKMAAWEICLQNVFNAKQTKRRQKQRRICITFTVYNIFSVRHVTVRQFNVWRQTLNCLTFDRDAVDIR